MAGISHQYQLLAPASLSGVNRPGPVGCRRDMPDDLDVARRAGFRALRGIAEFVGHETAIDEHQDAVVAAQGRHDLASPACRRRSSSTKISPSCAKVPDGFDLAGIRPCGRRSQRLSERTGAAARRRVALGDERLLPCKPLELPDAEADEDGAAEDRGNEDLPGAARHPDRSRPSWALVFHCWQSSMPLTGRSRISGRMTSSGNRDQHMDPDRRRIGGLDAEDRAHADECR